MKKICTKVLLTVLIAMLVVSTFAMTRPVEASEIATPYTYVGGNFAFQGSKSISELCSGTFLTIGVTCRSSNSDDTITLKVFVSTTNTTKTYTFKADGQAHEYKNIYLGLGSGNKNVTCTFTNSNSSNTVTGAIIWSS